MAKDDPYFRMRIPREIKDWIENEAKENKRSQNSQIIYCIEQQKKQRRSCLATDPLLSPLKETK